MKALFDFSFTTFIAPSIAKIVYFLVMAVIAVSYLLFVVVAFQATTVFGLFVMLIIGPLVALLYLVLARVGLESLIATIRTAENTGELVRRAGNVEPVTADRLGPPRPATRRPSQARRTRRTRSTSRSDEAGLLRNNAQQTRLCRANPWRGRCQALAHSAQFR